MLTWEKRLGWVSLIVYLLFTAFCMFFNGLYTGYPETDWSDCCPAWEMEGCWIYYSRLLITYYLFYFMAVNYIPSYSEIRYIHTLYFLFFTNWNLLLYFFLQMLKHALTLWCRFYNWLIGFINPCSQQVPQYCSSCKRSLKLLYY